MVFLKSNNFKYLILAPILFALFAYGVCAFIFYNGHGFVSLAIALIAWTLSFLLFSSMLQQIEHHREHKKIKASRPLQNIQIEVQVNDFLTKEYPEAKSQLENEIAGYLQGKLIDFENKTGFQPKYIVICVETVAALGQPDKSIITSVEVGTKNPKQT